MKLKITTTGNATVYDNEIEQVSLPGEKWEVVLYWKSLPSIVKLVPWVIKIQSKSWEKQKFSISKWIALVNASEIRVTVSVVSEKPLAKIVELRWNQQLLELKLQKVKTYWSVEEISSLIWEIEKVKADIQLAEAK
jgi:F0F1-type ATP synthase epsilon subunit